MTWEVRDNSKNEGSSKYFFLFYDEQRIKFTFLDIVFTISNHSSPSANNNND